MFLVVVQVVVEVENVLQLFVVLVVKTLWIVTCQQCVNGKSINW